MTGRFLALLAALTVIGLIAPVHEQSQAQSQTWPQRPVRIVVPYAAGGNSNSMARIVAQRLSEAFGQQFIVENRLGANGAIASEAVARAPADGYTLLWGATPPITIRPGDDQGVVRFSKGLCADQRGRDQRIRAARQQGRAGEKRRRVRRPCARATQQARL